MSTLTLKQQQLLDFIRRFQVQQGMPPTRVEIARGLRIGSTNTVEFHLQALVRKGYVELLPGRNRNIRLLVEGELAALGVSIPIPLVGRVAAGAPVLAVEHIEGYYRCADLFQPQADYLLRVQGSSMRDAGIGEGDLLAVHRTPQARNGQIVVARLDEEVTVKRLEASQGRLRLLPENPDYAPIEVDPKRQVCVIEGVAVGVIRRVS
jgi:repressor LexA